MKLERWTLVWSAFALVLGTVVVVVALQGATEEALRTCTRVTGA